MIATCFYPSKSRKRMKQLQKWRNYRIQGYSDLSPPCWKAFSKIKPTPPCIQCKIHQQWIGEYFHKLSNRLLLWSLQKGSAYLLVRFLHNNLISVTFCAAIGTFHLKQSKGEQFRQTWWASELHGSFSERTHEMTQRPLALILIGQKNTKVFWQNQKPEGPTKCNMANINKNHNRKV